MHTPSRPHHGGLVEYELAGMDVADVRFAVCP